MFKQVIIKKFLKLIKRKSIKPILYVDMDNVLVDFQSGIDSLSITDRNKWFGIYDQVPDIFSHMKPYTGAIVAMEVLKLKYDIYFLSTSPWENPTAASDKVLWIQRYFPTIGYKRLILSHNKHLNAGHYLIDDRVANGAGDFVGEHILFGQGKFEKWSQVVDYLM